MFLWILNRQSNEPGPVTLMARSRRFVVLVISVDKFTPAVADITGLLPSVADVVALPLVPDPVKSLPPVGNEVMGFDHQFLPPTDDIEGRQIIFAVKQAKFRDVKLPLVTIVGTQDNLGRNSATRRTGPGQRSQ